MGYSECSPEERLPASTGDMDQADRLARSNFSFLLSRFPVRARSLECSAPVRCPCPLRASRFRVLDTTSDRDHTTCTNLNCIPVVFTLVYGRAAG